MKALINLSLFGVSLTLIFAALFFAYIAPESVSATDVSACGDLDAANAVYVLTANVSAAGTCFNILANNITLDGAGYWVNYSHNAAGDII